MKYPKSAQERRRRAASIRICFIALVLLGWPAASVAEATRPTDKEHFLDKCKRLYEEIVTLRLMQATVTYTAQR